MFALGGIENSRTPEAFSNYSVIKLQCVNLILGVLKEEAKKHLVSVVKNLIASNVHAHERLILSVPPP